MIGEALGVRSVIYRFYDTILFEKNSALYCANNMSLRSIVPYPEIGLRGGVLTFEHLPLHDIVRSALRRFFLRLESVAQVHPKNASIKSPRRLIGVGAGKMLGGAPQTSHQALLAFVAQHDETNLNDNTLPSAHFQPGRRRL